MSRFKVGEVVKVRCTLYSSVEGLHTGKVLRIEHGLVTCDVSGHQFTVQEIQVYKYDRVESDEEVKHFLDHIDELAELCRKGWKALLPISMGDPETGVQIVRDENDPRISLLNGTIEIHPAIWEKPSIARYLEKPGFGIVTYKYYPGSYHNPPDVEDIDLGVEVNLGQAARLALESLWKIHSDNYWVAEGEDAFYRELQGDTKHGNEP